MKIELRSGVWQVQVDSSGDAGVHWVHLVRDQRRATMHTRMSIERVSFRRSIEQAFTWPEERRLEVDGRKWRVRPEGSGEVDDASRGPGISAASEGDRVTGELPGGLALGLVTDEELAEILRTSAP